MEQAVARPSWLQHLPVAAALIDETLRYRAVNARWCRTFALAADEVVGRAHAELFEEDGGYWTQALRRVLQGAVVEGEEMLLKRRDGPAFWVRWWGQTCSLGQQRGVILVFEDQTEMHRTREALEASRRLLTRVLSCSLEGIMVLRPVYQPDGEVADFVWLLANPRAHALLRQSELEGRRLREVLPEAMLPGFFEACVQVVQRGEPLRRTFCLKQTDRSLWLEMAATRLDEGVAVIFRDVTEAREAEAKLREREQLFRLLAENMTDLVALHDAEGRIVYVSPSAERIVGYTPEELIGHRLEEFWHPEDRKRLPTLPEQAGEEDHPGVLVYRFRHRQGGYRWLETHVRAIRDETGRLVQLQTSSRDVTDRVEAEQALARSNETLQQRNRELQDFAYIASHDLQEPLRKVRAFAELLKEEYESVLDDEGRYYLDRMQDAAQRMSRLIEDLLTFSRVTTQGRPFERVDLHAILEQVLADLEVRIAETDAQVHVEGHWPVVEADPTQMRQLLQNLIGNALKFHHPERTPEVWLRARLEETPAGTQCVIEVQDNGIGFDEKYLDRIFSPFQRLHGRGRYAGTGMGLAICRRIVERHHGQLTARSRPDEGATFIVQLPLMQPPDAPMPSSSTAHA
ncbi:PAS domain-containing sensor histidine kinase [Rhodothermus marinus]|uniref:histidine kinase n=1 Tax=Rhodothermus marinus (strain ATCC 43812 / DSM 4252 / R-10) TaxID=518766 RepID=D0MF32_RHOM4|nr:PAS domain S-box protein [Rhodothermus marinus]ACY49288.1 PAS/PAC sensor signal transduction histidine kinase [Rhodothermus marinus DSM 4252]